MKQIKVKRFNFRGLIVVVIIACGSSLFISLEDNVLTNTEILRGLIAGIIAAFSFAQSPTFTIALPSIIAASMRESTKEKEVSKDESNISQKIDES